MRMSSIVHLNNAALSYFLQRDYNAAINYLNAAYFACLREMNDGSCSSEKNCSSFEPIKLEEGTKPEEISMEEDVPEHDISGIIPPNKSPCHDPLQLPSLPDIESILSTAAGQACSASGGTFPAKLCQQSPRSSPGAYTMYNRALVLSPLSDEDEKMLPRSKAIILYNLALVHHNIGIHHGISSKLWKALQYYEAALDTVDQQVPKGDVDGKNGVSNTALCVAWRIFNVEKLLLAILNNMGNIHAHLFHFENTRACMESLRMILEASMAVSKILDEEPQTDALNSEDGSRKEETILSEDYIFFLLNSLFQGEELRLAAAA